MAETTNGTVRRMIPAAIGVVAWFGLAEAERAHGTESRDAGMRIRLETEDGRSFTATLADNPSARDFASLLPLNLTLKDYASTEKISDLPRRLSTADAPDGFTPSPGDLAYYAPWGNLAIFYRDFRHSPGLVRLGRVQGDLAMFGRPGPLKVRIDRQPASTAGRPRP